MATKKAAGEKKKSIDFERIKQDFRNLDPNDPGTWPLIPRLSALAAVGIAVIAAAWWFDWQPLNESLARAQAEEQTLREQWLIKKRQAINLEEHKQQLAEIDRQFGALLKQLPNKAEMDDLLAQINQAGLGQGLNFDLFRPGGENMRDFYVEMPVAIRIFGSYHELGAFIEDVAKMPRIVTMANMQLDRQDSGTLKFEASAVTYRYLDEAETAAQKQAKDAAKAKK